MGFGMKLAQICSVTLLVLGLTITKSDLLVSAYSGLNFWQQNLFAFLILSC